MAQIYADLIKKGLKTIDDVPAKLKDAVQWLNIGQPAKMGSKNDLSG